MSVALAFAIQDLFPAGAVAAEHRGLAAADELLPAEAEGLGRAVAKRVGEYAAGRRCARRALAELGIEGFAVRRAADRAPIWPDGITGSITHTDGYCAAVVARRGAIAAVGLDTEMAGAVGPHLWPAIALPAESEWLSRLPEAERAPAAAFIFSAKEAFYKCQYQAIAGRFDFHDVMVVARTWGPQTGEFTITLRAPPAQLARAALAGRYLRHEVWVSTGVTLFSS